MKRNEKKVKEKEEENEKKTKHFCLEPATGFFTLPYFRSFQPTTIKAFELFARQINRFEWQVFEMNAKKNKNLSLKKITQEAKKR